MQHLAQALDDVDGSLRSKRFLPAVDLENGAKIHKNQSVVNNSTRSLDRSVEDFRHRRDKVLAKIRTRMNQISKESQNASNQCSCGHGNDNALLVSSAEIYYSERKKKLEKLNADLL